MTTVGATDAPFSATVPLTDVAKTAAYTRACEESTGFLTLLSDGRELTGAYAAVRRRGGRTEAGEWLQQATPAIRARVPLDVLRDTIQPFPTFSEIYVPALKALRDMVRAGQAADRAGR
jgi:dihydrolipoamide dehydrogenase